MMVRHLTKLLTLTMIILFCASCVKDETDCILFCAGDSKIEFSPASISAPESSGMTLITIKVVPAPIVPITVNYRLIPELSTATLGDDFTFSDGSITFAAGQSTATIPITIIDDVIANEGAETVVIELSAPSSGLLGTNNRVTISIVDNDIANLAVAEGATAETIAIDCSDGSGATQFYAITSVSDTDVNCSLTAVPVKISCGPNYKSGHANWDATVNATCTINGNVNPISFDVNVTDTNRAPTITSISTISLASGAKTGSPVTITYENILANAVGLADADLDTIHFRIQSIDNGTVLKNGLGVSTGTTYISAGESFTWTPSSSALGNTNAFKISAYDGMSASAAVQVVIANVMNFTPPTTLAVAEQGSLTSPSLACDDDSGVPPTYTLTGEPTQYTNCAMSGDTIQCTNVDYHPSLPGNWNQTLTVTCEIGAVSSTKSIILNVTNTNQKPQLPNPISNFTGGSAGVNYSITHANLITNAVGVNDPDGQTIRFKLASAVVGGTLRKGGVIVNTGEVLSPLETWVYTPDNATVGEIIAFSVYAYDGIDNSDVAQDVTIVFNGMTQLPDLALNEGSSSSPVTLNCYNASASAVTYTIDTQSDADSNCSISGVHPLAEFSCSPNFKAGQADYSSNLIVKCFMDAIETYSQTFTVDVSNVNRAPTLTSTATLAGAVFGAPFTITYADLSSNSDEADLDSDAISFEIDSVSNGTMTKSGAPVTAGTRLAVGEEFIWTPSGTSVGLSTMFNMRAYDGTTNSTSSIAVKTMLEGIAPIADLYVGEGETATTATMLCGDVNSSIVDAYTLTVNPADVGCSIFGGNSISCTPIFRAGQAAWSEVVTVECDLNGTGGTYTRDVNIMVNSTNRPPVFTGAFAQINAATINTAFTISYADLVTAIGANVNDPDGDAISFVLSNVLNGTINKPLGTIVGVGETFQWTPASNTLGIVSAIEISAYDGELNSITSPTLTIGVEGFVAIENISTTEGGSTFTSALTCTDSAANSAMYTITNQTNTLANCDTTSVAGSIYCEPDYKSGSDDWTSTITVQCAVGVETYNRSFDLSVTNANQPPELTAVTSYNVEEAQPLTISWAELISRGGVTDADGDPLVFKIDNVPLGNGTITKGGAPIVEGVTTIAAGESVVWTPPAIQTTGMVMMRISVTDGVHAYTTPSVDVASVIMSFAGIANITTDENITGTSPLSCTDGTANTPVYGIISQSDPDATCSIVGTDVSCTPAIKPSNANWTATVQVGCALNSLTITQDFTLNVNDVNQLPTMTTISTLPNPVLRGATINITFNDLLTASNADDHEDAGNDLCFKINSYNSGNGTLYDHLAVEVVAGTSQLCQGQTWSWEPLAMTPAGDTTVAAFVAVDTQLAESLVPVNLNINVFVLEAAAPLITVAENATSAANAITCDDGSMGAKSYSITGGAADLNCSMNADDLECAPDYRTTNDPWPTETITLRCTIGANFKEITVDVDVTDTNRLPVGESINLTGVAETGVNFPVDFNQVVASATDADGDTDLKYCINTVHVNTITVEGSAPTLCSGGAGATIATTNSVVFNADAGVHGSTITFDFRIIDSQGGQSTGLYEATFNVVDRAVLTVASISSGGTTTANFGTHGMPGNESITVTTTISKSGNADAVLNHMYVGEGYRMTGGTCPSASGATFPASCTYTFTSYTRPHQHGTIIKAFTLNFNDGIENKYQKMHELTHWGATGNSTTFGHVGEDSSGSYGSSITKMIVGNFSQFRQSRDLIVLKSSDKYIKLLSRGGSYPTFDSQLSTNFADPPTSIGSQTPIDVANADMDGDGRSDLIVITSEGYLLVYLNSGVAPYFSNTFSYSMFLSFTPTALTPVSVLAESSRGALNDLILIDSTNRQLVVLKNASTAGSVSLSESGDRINVAGLAPYFIDVEDINLDGLMDFAIAASDHNQIQIYKQNTDKTFVLSDSLNITDKPNIYKIQFADTDATQDGRPELLVLCSDGTNYSIENIVNDSGRFNYTDPSTFNVSINSTNDFEVAKILGSHQSVLVRESGDSHVYIYQNNGNDTFSTKTSISANPAGNGEVTTFKIFDLGGDGALDIATHHSGAKIRFGEGN